MDNNQNNFLDNKTLLAIVLVGAVWFGWKSYIDRKYGNPEGPSPVVASPEETGKTMPPSETKPNATTTELAPATETASQPLQAEDLIAMDVGNISFKVSTLGMGFRDIQLNSYKDRESGAPIQLVPDKGSVFGTQLVGSNSPLVFEITKVDESTLKGVARKDGITFTKLIKVNAQNYSFETTLDVTGVNEKFLGVRSVLRDQVKHFASSSFLVPNTETQELVVRHSGSLDRVNVTSQKENYNKDFSQASVLSLGSHYFATAVVDKSEIFPEAQVKTDLKDQVVTGELIYKPANPTQNINLKYVVYAGPKSIDILESVDRQLSDVINLGMFSVIAKPLLRIMKWFHEGVGNWGVAVILLTLLVRLFVLPFNVMSYKSMKNMQKVQPILQGLRERYKDDQQTLNREMMGVMKQHKVNPLGGCLPMLLQFPIFLALYQVFGQSIELYQAPFILWIHDLSQKDPFYILPVLMGIAMFLQQKLTPTTMDPAQAKILMFMPIVFSFMMISLPSGLTLYIFISTLFSILQQAYFLRDNKTTTVAAKEVKA